MDQQNVQSTGAEKNGFQELLYVLKKNILLILIITVVATAIGGVFAIFRKPDYIAEEQVLYRMGDGSDVASDINTMNAYKDTIMDFCDNGVVVDRANFYFYNYVKDGYELDKFINDVKVLEKELKSYQDEIDALEKLDAKIDDLIKLTASSTTIDSLIFQAEIEKAALCQQVLIIEHIRTLNTQLNATLDVEQANVIKNEISVYEEYLIQSKRNNQHVSAVSEKLPWTENGITTTEKLNEQKTYVGERITSLGNSIVTLRTNSKLYYSVDKQNRITDYIKTNAIGVNEYTSNDSDQTFDFGVTYLDNTEKTAKEKVKILVLAFDIESSYFFTDLHTTIEDMGPLPCRVDIEKGTIVLIAFAVGLVLSLLVVYLIQLFDKTVKSKEQVESITGYPVLACIEKQEEEKA